MNYRVEFDKYGRASLFIIRAYIHIYETLVLEYYINRASDEN